VRSVGPDGRHALVTGWFDNHVYLVGFEGSGGHPQEARRRIETWARRPHYHPPADSDEGKESKVAAKTGG